MWHTIPHVLVLASATTTWVSRLVSFFVSQYYTSQVSLSGGFTWIWSGTRAAWSHCGWPCPWLAGAAGRRRGSPRRTSTGVCSSWSWPAGTQTCVPAPDPARSDNNQTLWVCVCVCAPALVCICVCDRIRTWSSSSTTTNVSRLFLKSSRVILGLENPQTNYSPLFK